MCLVGRIQYYRESGNRKQETLPTMQLGSQLFEGACVIGSCLKRQYSETFDKCELV
jgi:hypothetical protein